MKSMRERLGVGKDFERGGARDSQEGGGGIGKNLRLIGGTGRALERVEEPGVGRTSQRGVAAGRAGREELLGMSYGDEGKLL